LPPSTAAPALIFKGLAANVMTAHVRPSLALHGPGDAAGQAGRGAKREDAMNALLDLILLVLRLYSYLLVAWVVLSWLIAFNVINTHNRFVYAITDFLDRITEPVLRPIRRVLPTMNGIDLSPVVLILLIYFLSRLLIEYWPT
jgi:YggT family protein